MLGSTAIRCPSCARQQEPSLICSECETPLAPEMDFFAALGIARRLKVDEPELERIYHKLSRRVHPDRFTSRTSAVRDASLRTTALLTRSYRTLRDPVSRGLYWLELNGEKLAKNNSQVPSDLSNLVFEVQEQLEELRAGGKDGDEGRLQEDLIKRRQEIGCAMDMAHTELRRNFTAWDSADRDNRNGLLNRLKAILSRIAYLRTLLRDLDRALEPEEQF